MSSALEKVKFDREEFLWVFAEISDELAHVGIQALWVSPRCQPAVRPPGRRISAFRPSPGLQHVDSGLDQQLFHRETLLAAYGRDFVRDV